MNTSNFSSPSQSLEELNAAYRRSVALDTAMTTPISDMEAQAQIHLEAEVLRAIATAKYLKKDLAQIARWSAVPIENIEEIAKRLAAERGLDLEHCEFNAMVREVQEIDGLKDQGFREWKLQAIARRFHRSRRELMEAYNKAQIRQLPIQPKTISELRTANTVQVSWVVQGWFPAGVSILLHALGGTGKTLMLYEVATAIAKGTPWNGYPVQKGEVLILQSDEPAHITQDRLEVLGVTDDDPLKVFPGWQVEHLPQLEAYLQSRQDAGQPIRFLLVDSVTAINRNTAISENDVEYARPIAALSDLAARFGCCVVFVHHSNGFGDARGTKALHNTVSEVWALIINNEATGERVLRIQKNRVGRPPGRYKFNFEPSSGTFTYTGEDGDEGSTATHAKRVELWLNEPTHKGIPYEAEELGELLAIPTASARRALADLWEKGIIHRERARKDNRSRFLYWTGELLQTLNCDHSTPVDHSKNQPIATAIECQDPLPEEIVDPRDRCDRQNAKNLTIADRKKERSQRSQRSNASESEFQSDHSSDRQSDHLLLIDSSDRVPMPGDMVIAKGTAVWFKTGSDKLNSRILRPSQKDSASIPIQALPDEVFHELTAPCKVIERNRTGDRLKIRNQQTGRTWVCNAEGLEVLP